VPPTAKVEKPPGVETVVEKANKLIANLREASKIKYGIPPYRVENDVIVSDDK